MCARLYKWLTQTRRQCGGATSWETPPMAAVPCQRCSHAQDLRASAEERRRIDTRHARLEADIVAIRQRSITP